MKVETFFEKFDQLTDATNSVAKLREVVLEWAGAGRLSNNQSAEWKKAVLGDVIELFSGQHLLADDHNNEGRGIPYLTGPSDFGEKHPIPTRWTDRPKITAEPGDILLTVKGSGIGKTNVLLEQPTAISRQLMAIRVTDADPEFVYVILKRAAKLFQKLKTGIAIPGIGRRDVLGLKVVLPSLAVQKQIVAKVDELMALCDRLEAQLQERDTQHAALARASLSRFAEAPTPANLDFLFHEKYTIEPADLRKAILSLAVQGKLVLQDPNDEAASVALGRIEKQRERLIAEKQFRRLQLPTSAEEESFDIPASWKWTRLGNAMLNVTDGFHSTPKPTEAGVRYITAKHVKPGRIDFEACLYVSEEDFQEIATKTRPRKGDILIVNIGAGCGLPAIIGVDFEFAFKNVAILNRPEDVDPKFLFNYLLFRRDEIFEDRTKGGAQPFLSLGMLREIPFPLPPLAEQRRIGAKVDQLFSLVDQLEVRLTASRATATSLMNAVVAELTTGA